jgi:hypothetical protein
VVLYALRDSAELEVCAFFSDQAYLDRSDARKTVLLFGPATHLKIDNDGGSNERRQLKCNRNSRA